MFTISDLQVHPQVSQCLNVPTIAAEKTAAQSYWLFNYLAPRLARRDFDDGFAIDLLHKDHRLFGELAAQHNAPTPLNDLALLLYGAMQAQGLGRKDLTEAANVAAKQSGVSRFDN